MWLSLICIALLIAVVVRQATEGLFSAFIMTMLTICCAAAAFGTYEWAAANLLAPYWKPDFSLPIALGVLFGVPLLVLRLAFDRLIRRACLLPAWVDRLGGGVCGLVTGLIVVGVAANCVQMIPFAYGSVVGYSRTGVVDPAKRAVEASPRAADEERELFLRPDRFAAGLAAVLSDGIFSGRASFFDYHPDLLQSVGWVGAVHADVSRFAKPGSISVVTSEPVQFVYTLIPGNPRQQEEAQYEPMNPPAGREFRMVRVRLGNEARDTRRSHVFTLRQFKLVGEPKGGGGLEQYHPIAIQQEDPNEIPNRHIRYRRVGKKDVPVIDDMYAPRDDHPNEVEIVFELPVGFAPNFLEYKHLARVSLSFNKAEGRRGRESAEGNRSETRPEATSPKAPTPEAAPPEASGRGVATPEAKPPPASTQPTETVAEQPEQPNTGRKRAGGRVKTVAAGRAGSHFGDDMPMTMRAYQRYKNAEISREALTDGHLVGEVDAQQDGTDPPVSKFDVPEDKRLLQLRVDRMTARSLLGHILSQAISTVQNYFVMDARGRQYPVVGKYAIADARGRKVIEVQYFSHRVGTIGSLGKFNQIDEQKLGPDDVYALLFLVDPGARIVSFSSGGAASRRDDLRSENLVAPQ